MKRRRKRNLLLALGAAVGAGVILAVSQESGPSKGRVILPEQPQEEPKTSIAPG